MSAKVKIRGLNAIFLTALLTLSSVSFGAKTVVGPQEYVSILEARSAELLKGSRPRDQIFSEIVSYEVQITDLDQMTFAAGRIKSIFGDVLAFSRELLMKNDPSSGLVLQFLINFARVENIPYQGLVRSTCLPAMDMLEEVARNPKLKIHIRRGAARAVNIINSSELIDLNEIIERPSRVDLNDVI